MKPYKVLLIDSEPESARILGASLHSNGDQYQFVSVRNGVSALALVGEHVPSIIVLGAALVRSGFEICRQLKADSSTRRIPVIILSAHAAEEDRIRAFELGADDYITQPFSAREVVLRIKKSLERTQVVPVPTAQPKIVFGPLVLDPVRHEVTLDREKVPMTPIGFRLLELLMNSAGTAVSRKTILQEIWPESKHTANRTLDAHIKRLRERLGPMARAIETITGFGYRMVEPSGDVASVVESEQAKLNELVFAINRMKIGKDRIPGLKKKLNPLLAIK